MPCCLHQATDPCVIGGCSQRLYSFTLITQPKPTQSGTQAGRQATVIEDSLSVGTATENNQL